MNVNLSSQVILGLCGVVISVTGFSGANILKGGSVSSGFLVAGIVFIIASVSLAMLAFAQIRWVTQDLDDDLIHFITMVLKVEILASLSVHYYMNRVLIFYCLLFHGSLLLSANDHCKCP